MVKLNKKSGFTLLELIVVIIIIAVLASLALPNFFRTITQARAAEALRNLGTLRGSVQRCLYARADDILGTLQYCQIKTNLDISDPDTIVGHKFTYVVNIIVGSTRQTPIYTIVATDIVNTNGAITINQDGTRTGTLSYTTISG